MATGILDGAKKEADHWAVLFRRALADPDCLDTEEATVVADLALASLPVDAVLAVEDEHGSLHHEGSGRYVKGGTSKGRTKKEVEEEKKHKFSTTQFDLKNAGYARSEAPLAKIKSMGERIDEEDLADDGREDSPHVTVKYGLHTDDKEAVAATVKGFGPVSVRLGKTFIFPATEKADYDVVNIAVESPDLHRLNMLIADSLECTDTHPNYIPHVCLAYVKPGKGEKYVGMGDVKGLRLFFEELIFSSKSRDKTDCRLSLKELSAKFSYDIFNRKAQGILNRAIEASKKLTAGARADLEKALKVNDPAEVSRALIAFVQKHRVQLADLLTTTQLAALLEGAREVAKSIPTVPMFPGAQATPATLEPKRAMELLDEMKALTPPEREARIYDLPADQQKFVKQGLLAQQQGGEQPPGPFVPQTPPNGTPDRIHYPVIDEAAQELAAKNVMTRVQFDALDNAARQKAFTVAHVESLDTIDKIRNAIAENIEQGADLATFRQKVLEAVDEGTFMSDAHLEVVFRTNIQTAFSDGQMKVLQHPFVRSGFPYVSYEAIDDDRVEHDHLALMTLGIGGTNIYRIDDPVFLMFRPPWRWSCRCSWIPMTVRAAAAAGIAEAQKWLDDGVEPSPPEFVAMPSFRPPPGFERSLSAAPLSIKLSCANIHNFLTPTYRLRKPRGKKRRARPNAMLSVVSAMFAQVHAPAGEPTVIGGKTFQPGEFIPGDVLKGAPEPERAALLNKAHLRRADDEEEVLSHQEEGAYAAQKASDHKTLAEKTKMSGLDREFAERVAAHLATHVEAESAKYIDGLTALIEHHDEAGWDEDAAKKVGAVRDDFEEHLSEQIDLYKKSLAKHFVKLWGEGRFTADRCKVFEEEIDALAEDLNAQNYALANEVIDAIGDDAMSMDQWNAMGNLDDEAGALADRMKRIVDEVEEETRAAIEYEEEVEDEARQEVADAHFDDLRSDVEADLTEDSTQEEIDAAWAKTLRDCNKTLAADEGDYRISLDESGDLEVVYADDLPDEFNSEGEKKLSVAAPLKKMTADSDRRAAAIAERRTERENKQKRDHEVSLSLAQDARTDKLIAALANRPVVVEAKLTVPKDAISVSVKADVTVPKGAINVNIKTDPQPALLTPAKPFQPVVIEHADGTVSKIREA